MHSTDRHQRALALFDELAELTETARARAMLDLAARDAGLHAEVAGLLAADAQAEGVLEREHSLHTDAGEVDAEPADDTLLGQRVGPWRIEGILGRGGMGTVYRGTREDGQFEQRAAIKLIRLGMDRPETRRRFLQERQILARLQHPNIATLLDGGVADSGVPYFAMELVDGVPIDTWCDGKQLDLHARVRLFLQACAAVAHAHRNLAVHRDLKPGNILIDQGGQLKLLDFGIAKLLEDEAGQTQTRDRPLTPEYAAPEQLRGDPVTTATDVYALGVVLYALLAGAHPFAATARTPLARHLALLEREPQAITQAAAKLDPARAALRGLSPKALASALRGDLAAIVHRCLESEPARRYGSAEALAADLKAWLDGLPVTARIGQRGYRLRKFVRRNRLAVASAALVVLALVGGLGAALWQADIARAHAVRADAEASRAEREAAQVRTQVERTRKVKDFFVQTLVEADPMQRTTQGPVTVAQALDAAIERAGTELASDPVLQADVFDDFGELRAGQGRFDESLALFQHALAVAEKEYGPDHPVVAETLNNIAAVHNYRGDELAGANEIERAVAILDKDDGGDPVLHANALSTLASVRQQQGDTRRMREAMQRAADIFRSRAPEHPQFVHVLTNLATVARGEGHVADAERGFREVIARVEKSMGLQSPHLWPSLSALINIAYERGDKAGELALARRALAVARHNFPQDHPWVASSLNELGWILAREGNMAEGEPLMREGIAMLQRLDSAAAVSARRRLAVALYDNGQGREAAAEFEAAWAACVERKQQANQVCATLRANRARMLAVGGKAEFALREAEAATAALAALDSALPSERAQALQAKATALSALGRASEALAAQDGAIALLQEAFGAGHPETRQARVARERMASPPNAA